MAAKYRIFQEHGLKLVEISHETDLAELRSLATQYFEDPIFSPTHRQLIDLSKVKDAKASFIDVFTLRNFYLRGYRGVDEPVKIAIFAPTDLTYGISKMFSSLMIGQKIMRISVHSTLDTAAEALGFDEMMIRRLQAGRE